MMQATVSRKTATWLVTLLMGAALSACSSYKPPKPTPLQQNPASVAAATSWTQKLAGNVQFPLLVAADGDQVVLGSSNGQVQALQASTGASLWQAQAGKSLSAGVGTDGTTSAVVVDNNMLVALRNGQEVWRTRLASQAYTAPLVAGGRVFVLTAEEIESLALSEAERQLLRPYHRPCEIGRYYLADRPSRWLIARGGPGSARRCSGGPG